MRGFLATSIGVACSAALILPLCLPSGAAVASASGASDPPGSTQSLPLAAVDAGGSNRSLGPGAGAVHGLTRRDVRPFSLVGIIWDDVQAELHGTVQIRVRAVGSTRWSGWQDVETHNHEHAADPGTAESDSGKVRGSTAPLWVGESDGVEVRVRPEAMPLPEGLRLELVDPGDDPEAESTVEESTAEEPMSAAEARSMAGGVGARSHTRPYIGPRPRIITRKGWGASESLREEGFVYSKAVKAAFVHHSATGNGFTCKQAPSVLRSIYRYHVKSSGWRDIGYNFAVDKCGNIYEGRAGGVAKAVRGAHTLGFNTNSMGVAVLGTYSHSTPPAAAVNAVARLTAWKLGLYGVNPRGQSVLTSQGSNKYKKGRKVSFNAISGHRDGFLTECPGSRLYGKLGTARTSSAAYQGRR
ncbi:peptidoglycan recognition protein [Streptomyces sp. NPDC052236]|uniref:peptidoglycan recognition protein n=1 Tax=Streptomyces sp. NPDC052236 TaxID=3365686 RepID=UPI0037CF6155